MTHLAWVIVTIVLFIGITAALIAYGIHYKGFNPFIRIKRLLFGNSFERENERVIAPTQPDPIQSKKPPELIRPNVPPPPPRTAATAHGTESGTMGVWNNPPASGADIRAPGPSFYGV